MTTPIFNTRPFRDIPKFAYPRTRITTKFLSDTSRITKKSQELVILVETVRRLHVIIRGNTPVGGDEV